MCKGKLLAKPTKAHLLASSSRNETITTDLKEALLDFLVQTGQTNEAFKDQLFPIGGDGLTSVTVEVLTQVRSQTTVTLIRSSHLRTKRQYTP